MKLILVILPFLFFQANAQQYVANWSGWGHSMYHIQYGLDSSHWVTLDSLPGIMDSSDYQFDIPVNNFYYRVTAGKDTTCALFTPEALSISTDSLFTAPNTRVTTLDISVQVTSQLHFTIKSPQSQSMAYELYDAIGRLIHRGQINLFKGTNNFFDSKPVAKGVYYAQFVGYFNTVTLKLIL